MKKISLLLVASIVASISYALAPAANSHIVKSKETFYSISRIYNISPKDLMKANEKFGPDFTLKVNDIVILPISVSNSEQASNSNRATNSVLNNAIQHKVERGETFYAIARKYNTDVMNLMAQNAKYAPSYHLSVNDIVVVSPTTIDKTQQPIETKTTTHSGEIRSDLKSQIPTKTFVENTTPNAAWSYIHRVEPGQSLKLISKIYNVSFKKLRKLNSHLTNLRRLKINDVIVLGDKINTESNQVSESIPQQVKVETNAPTSKNPFDGGLSNIIHFSKDGQTLKTISKMYTVDIKILQSLNPTLPVNEPLFEGTKIVLYKRNNYFDEEATSSR